MQIAFVIYDGLTVLDLVGPLEVLARLPDAEVALVATTPGAVVSDTGAIRLSPDRLTTQMPAPDVVVVPGGPGTLAATQDPGLTGWLQQAATGARWVTSVCSGSHVLGVAGLLAGRRATSHWATLAGLEHHGAIPVAERVVIDGNVATAAGVSAGLDLALWLAAELTDDDLAKALQLVLEYDPAPPFDTGTVAKAGPALAARARQLLLETGNAP